MTDITSAPIVHLNVPRRRSRIRREIRQPLWQQIVLSPSGAIGTAILTLLVLCTVFADVIAPHGTRGDFAAARLPEAWKEGGSSEYLLGTNRLGQDLFSRIIYGSRVSLVVAVGGVAMAASIGVTLGLISGYMGGWVDRLVSSFVNLILSIPYLVLVIVAATIFGRSLLNVVLIFGFTGSPIFVRLTRGEVLRIRSHEYIEAAQSLGAKPGRVILRHIFPNLVGALITLGTFEMSQMIIYESGLSFLGLSVPPEIPSWGNLLREGMQGSGFLIFPWLAIYPALAITIVTLSVNLLGDRLRDVLDPRLRNS